MSESEMSKEEQVLKMVKKVLTDVARDTHVKPGLKHPLSDNTIMGIRDCLALITAREKELAEEAGQESEMRPRFPDQKPKSVVVSLDKLKTSSDLNTEKD
jgi:hypothetical protein